MEHERARILRPGLFRLSRAPAQLLFLAALFLVAFLAARFLAVFLAARFLVVFFATRFFAAFLAVVFLVAFFATRFFAAFLAARFRVVFFATRFFAAFFATRFFAAFLAVVFLVAFLAALFFVTFLAGGTGTTFLREHSLKGSSNFGVTRYASGVSPAPYTTRSGWRYELTRLLNSEPTVNFTDVDAAIWMGSRVCGFIPVRALRADGANVPNPGSVTLSPSATAACTEPMNAFNALSASILLRFEALAIASTSSLLFTSKTSAHRPVTLT